MDQLTETLRAIVDPQNVNNAPDELLVYECDGLTQHKYGCDKVYEQTPVCESNA